MEVTGYPAPVNELLRLGEPPASRKQWPDYRSLGLGQEHVPDLIRMVADDRLNRADTESLEVWAPLHAVRALGQLEAAEAVQPLLAAMATASDGDDDWMLESIPVALGLIGPAAIPAAAAYLDDEAMEIDGRSYIAHGLKEIAQRHPVTHNEVVAILRRQLEKYERNDPMLNSALIAELVELKAVEAAPVIEQAFSADQVEEMLVGDWVDVRLDLGLEISEDERREREARRRRWTRAFANAVGAPRQVPRRAAQTAAMRLKARRKQARRSRKQNRRR